jgi:hypothetical protein
MVRKQKQAWLFLPFVALLLAVLLAIAGCGGTPAPTPTLRPQPTFALEVSPGTEVQVGKSVAIVAKVEPLEKLDIKWSRSGTAEGKLNTNTGEQVVYTAGEKEGVDIVVAEGITASGVPVKQTVSLTVVGKAVAQAPTPTVTPVLPTDTPVPPTDTPVPPTPTPQPSPVAPITLTSLQDGQSVPCENLARGTYSADIRDHIWPVVYIGNRYHPQDEAGKAPPMVNGNWYGTIRFGDCTKLPDYDKGKAFQLIIVTADEQANKAFEDYIAREQAIGQWPGMDSLPEGVKEYIRIAVIRE